MIGKRIMCAASEVLHISVVRRSLDCEADVVVAVNPYDRVLNADEIAEGDHRRMIGGMWGTLGPLQLQHLVADGLAPNMRLVDIGCGSLRGGVHFVDYLDAGNYFGLDLNASLLQAGYDVELAALGLQHKLPREQLVADDSFALSRFGVEFDVALAHSVFTHLPLNHIRRCLAEAAAVLRPGGRFYATFFERPSGHPLLEPYTHQPGGITTHLERNPYHYQPDELRWCARDLPFTVRSFGQWGHPRAQRMMCLERQMSGD